MYRNRYTIDAKGTWTRPGYSKYEVIHYRIGLRARAEAEGFSADFTISRAFGDGGLKGTFSIKDLEVFAPTFAKARQRAKRFIKEFANDLACTGPKLEFDNVRVF